MWRYCLLLAVPVLVLVGMPFVVQAGGNGAVKADLDVAEVYTNSAGQIRTRPIGPTIGTVIFSPTSSGMMNITVQVKDGAPNTTFQCYAIPPGSWGPDGDRTEVTLNKQGKATVHLQVTIPDPGVFIKVSLMNEDQTLAYCTEHVLDFED